MNDRSLVLLRWGEAHHFWVGGCSACIIINNNSTRVVSNNE